MKCGVTTCQTRLYTHLRGINLEYETLLRFREVRIDTNNSCNKREFLTGAKIVLWYACDSVLYNIFCKLFRNSDDRTHTSRYQLFYMLASIEYVSDTFPFYGWRHAVLIPIPL